MILCLLSSDINQDLSKCLASTKDSKPVSELTRGDLRARASRSHLELKMESSSLDQVWIESSWK